MLTRRLLLLAGCGPSTALAAAPSPAPKPALAVRLPRHISLPDPQLGYMQALVSLALNKAGSTAEVQPVDVEMQQGRSLLELAAGRSRFDLMWTLTDREREGSGLLPVRIPLDRGLMGWRLLLVRRADLPHWRQVSTLEQLRHFTAGQGHDWPDTAILKANGLPVVTSTGYEALFRMLALGRFDYFPRSILEIDAEVAGQRHPELAIAPDLMLHYPAAAYFFVSPQRPELAKDLLAGLEAAVADGSLQRLHREHFGPLLQAHPVTADRVLRLRNPLLPSLTPVHRPELWMQPGQT